MEIGTTIVEATPDFNAPEVEKIPVEEEETFHPGEAKDTKPNQEVNK